MVKARLSDTLGSLLRDIAYSRVKSDMFSRDASLEYVKDPVLKLFPVPRVEIRNADVELSFAVVEAQQAEVNLSQVSLSVLLDNLPGFREKLLSSRVKPSRRAPEFATVGDLLKDKRPWIEAEVGNRLQEYFRANIESLTPQIIDAPEGFGKMLARAAIPMLRDTLRAGDISVVLGTQLQNDITISAMEWSATVSNAVKSAIERIKVESFDLELAITKDELLNVPDSAIARVKVSVEIQNYEWTQIENEKGQIVQKLVVR